MIKKLKYAALVFSLQLSYSAYSQSWSLTGNAGTNSSTNFIGTIDNINLKIRTNNVINMQITASAGKVAIGNFTPVYKLDVKGGSINTDSLYRITGLPVLSAHSDNTFAGKNSGKSNTSGVKNTAYGNQSFFSNISGSFNTGCGAEVLYSNMTGSQNAAFGDHTLRSNTTGSYNTALGGSALNLNLTGNYNTAAGNLALMHNTHGKENTAVGWEALYQNTNGSYNTAVGMNALSNQTYISGSWESYNVAIGSYALNANVLNNDGLFPVGRNNTAVGSSALANNTDGFNNCAVGTNALSGNTTGGGNTALGKDALSGISTCTNCTALGYQSGMTTNLSNATAIGYSALADANNKVRIGNTSVLSIGGQVGWTAFSDARIKKDIKENVPGLTFINSLRPVTYNYDIQKEEELLGRITAGAWKGKHDIEKIQFSGFIAQEVEDAAKKINYDFSGVDKVGAFWGLRYSEFVMPLVNSVKELIAQNNDRDAAIIKMRNQVEELKTIIIQLEEEEKNGNTENLPISK